MAEQYQYPIDNSEYGACVVFSLFTQEPTDDSTQERYGALIADAQREDQALRNQYNQLESEVAASGQSVSEYKEQREELQNQFQELGNQITVWKGLEASSSKSNTINISGSSVKLYLPLGLAFRDNVTYENFDLGATGAAMEAGSSFAMSMVNGVGSFVQGITGSSGADVAKLAGIQLASKFGTFADEAAAAQKIVGGVTLNPNSRVLFKQPNIRDFTFSFKMIAKSPEEATMINDIIKFLRTELYPDEINVEVGGTPLSLGYRFPNKFNIEFDYKGEPIKGLAKIQPCYLREVSTTYNASNMAMHSDGNFMEVDMNLSFQETRALTRKKISEEGF